ncbi:hypothetical protein VKT23_006005 [Stygiomarasmius scandens]
MEERYQYLAEWRAFGARNYANNVVLVDKNGVSLVWYLPDLLGDDLKNHVFRKTKLIQRKLVKGIHMSNHRWTEEEFEIIQRGSEWQGDENLFVSSKKKRPRICQGVCSFSFGWRGTGYEWTTDEIAPSASLSAPENQVAQTKEWLREISPLQLTISLVLSFIHPEQFQAGKNTLDRSCDKQAFPRTEEWAKIWGSVFTTLTVISGRRAVPHVDSYGSMKHLDALVSLGTASTAKLVLRDLGATFSYKPGCSIFFSGRGWTHEVPHWGFGERICYASYTRPEMTAEHGVNVQSYPRQLDVQA